ncbi:hypothetical protein [Pseudonocardia sp. H11422]|uniref:hypothetical protein n=1 Tax=Pseudonocardia sp. H11422 TaxID=2835866 RepID=UPI001BDC6A96|nr:hypothetical protein [Pseudonocardia sp. H11422]
MGNNLARVRRDRGWKKSHLLRELRAAAARRKVTLPGDASLGRRVAVWENQDGAVSDLYRDLLCDVYGMSAVELGIADSPEPESPAEDTGAELLTLTRLDGGLVQVLGGHTQSLRLMDRRFGGAAVYAQTTAHVEMIENLIRNSVPGAVREAAAHQLSQAAALAGWQALDLGKVADAWRLHEIATAGGREARDRSGFSYARAQQAYVLIDAGRLDDARELVGASRATAGTRVPPVLQAWLHAAEGEALAVLGRRDEALRALDAAAEVIPDQPVDESLPYLMLDAGHLARWRGHCLARLGDAGAIDDLKRALEAMGEGQYGRAEVACASTWRSRTTLAAIRANRSYRPGGPPTSPAAPGRPVSAGGSRTY